METALSQLGEEVCKEWAKDNNIRAITTEDLEEWGEKLKKAKDKNLSCDDAFKLLDTIGKAVGVKMAKKKKKEGGGP